MVEHAPHATHTLTESDRHDLRADIVRAGGVSAFCRASGLREHVVTRLLAGLPVLEGTMLVARLGLERARAKFAPPKSAAVRRPRKAKSPAPVQPISAASEPPPAAA